MNDTNKGVGLTLSYQDLAAIKQLRAQADDIDKLAERSSLASSKVSLNTEAQRLRVLADNIVAEAVRNVVEDFFTAEVEAVEDVETRLEKFFAEDR
jgi:hypothetical protein